MRAVVALALLASCRFDVDRVAGDKDGTPIGRDGSTGSGDGAASIDGLAPNDGALTGDGIVPTWDGAPCNGIGDLCDFASVCPGSLACHSGPVAGACTTAGRAACNPVAPLCPPEAPMCLEDYGSPSTGVCASEFEVFCICGGTGSGAFTCPL